MSSTPRLISHDQTVSPLPSSPTPPPFVPTGKTPPLQARLTTSHASSQNVLPLSDLYRPTSPMQAKNPGIVNSRDIGGGGGCGSMESAASLLQSLKEDDDYNQVQKKRRSLLFSQSSTSSTGRATSEGSPVNKRYVKMGIMMSDSPTEVSTYRSHHFNNTNMNTGSSALSLSGSQTPPQLSGVAQSTGTGSRQLVIGQGTPPNQTSSAVDSQDYLRRNSPAYPSPCQSEGVSVSIRPYLEGNLPGDEIKEEDYEVIDLKDVGSVVDPSNRGIVVAAQNVQPSPPISVKSESVSVNSEESTSSPDSGYGNTPEYPNANANGEAKSVEESSHQNGVQDLHQESKLRASSDDTDGGFSNSAGADQRSSSDIAVNDSDNHLLTQEAQQAGSHLEGEDSLVRPSTGSSSSAVVSDCSSNEQRSRGGTNESLFSVESIISSPVQNSDTGALSSRGGGGDTQVFEKQQMKMCLGRQHSMPPSMGVDGNAKSSTTPRSHHPNSAGPFQFHTSPSSASLNYGTRSPSWGFTQPYGASLSGFSELHPSHPSHPSQPHTISGVKSSQSYHNIQRQVRHNPESQKKKFRSSSVAFSRNTETRSSKIMKSSTLSPSQDEKDYFQVTDELSRENSHFAMSEALLAVVEQYKANQYEQELELSTPVSPLSPLPNQSPGTVSSFLSDSPGSPSRWDTVSSVSTTTPSGWTPPSSVEGISSWGSFNTIDGDPNEGLSMRRSSRISLLELISSPIWDNSAESTAQKLIQYMATRLIGNESRENLNMSQMVLKLPTEFLTSLQLDEDLQKSVITSSAHMRGSREWAPPRTQIIYHIKTPSKNIQKDLAAQDYRCTGCGMKVDPSQARYFRFCTYTGRYFCHNCHTNATSIIPAYVMSKWSFKKYPVSNYARDLLNKFYSEPVFTAVPREIYDRVPLMAQARDLRRQLVSIKHYLKTCRSAAHLNLTFEGYAPWTIDLTSYSLEDFVEIKGGVKMRHLRSMLADAVAHVKSCPLCKGKGFVCEFCQNSNDIIFPFELQKIRKCKVCDCCFHKECYGKRQASCPRCLRLERRLKQRQEENKSPGDRVSSTRRNSDYSSEVK